MSKKYIVGVAQYDALSGEEKHFEPFRTHTDFNEAAITLRNHERSMTRPSGWIDSHGIRWEVEIRGS